MNSEAILKSDLLDILFEKRNKVYGAYILRKFYNQRLVRSIGFMMLSVTIVGAFTFLPETKKMEIPFFETIMGHVPNPKVEGEKKKTPVPTKAEPAQKKAAGLPVIAKNDTRVDTLQDVDPLQKTAVVAVAGTEPGNNTGNVAGVETPATIVDKAPVITADINAPVADPEIMPQFPGGTEALKKFLQRNLHNPRDLDEGEKISVKVKFVVGYDGKLKSFELVENGGTEFNDEVIRVLKKMPEWVPGKTKGQNVSVYYTIPVKFIAEQ